MIGVDLIGQIRRAYFEQHRSIKEIVRTLSVSRATVQVQTTARYAHLYRVPEILTLGRFPDARESDSTWRTQEVRHVGSDTIAPRF